MQQSTAACCTPDPFGYGQFIALHHLLFESLHVLIQFDPSVAEADTAPIGMN
jgi:hypothetical protein